MAVTFRTSSWHVGALVLIDCPEDVRHVIQINMSIFWSACKKSKSLGNGVHEIKFENAKMATLRYHSFFQFMLGLGWDLYASTDVTFRSDIDTWFFRKIH
jgi:hypothetical protein